MSSSCARVSPAIIPGSFWLLFADQWDSKSPWADKRVRLAANLALDPQAINQAETLGFSRITGSIIPKDFELAWSPPLYPYDPKKAAQLLTEAGYPNGFDASAFLNGVGPRVAESGLGLIPGHAYSAPYEDPRLAPK